MVLEDWKNVLLIDPPVEFKNPGEERSLTYRKEFEHAMPMCAPGGWFLEFGVYKGFTINTCADILPNQTFYGFDSFEGLPEEWHFLNPNDKRVKTSIRVPKGHFALDKLPEVRKNVNLVKGFYDQSLKPWIEEHLKPGDTISWLHLDADLYTSTIYVLEQLNPYIVPGTIIRCDELVDWRLEEFPVNYKRDKPKPKYSDWVNGEWKALIVWMERYKREIKPLWREWHQGAGMIVEK